MCIKFNEIEVKRIKFYSFVMFAVTQSLLVVILSSSSQPKPKPNKQTTQDISFEPNNQQWFVDWTEWADAMINKHHEMIFNGFRKREKNCIKHHFRSVSFVSFHFFSSRLYGWLSIWLCTEGRVVVLIFPNWVFIAMHRRSFSSLCSQIIT